MAWSRLVFPVNVENNHWIVVLINLDIETIEIFDSMAGKEWEKTHQKLLKVRGGR